MPNLPKPRFGRPARGRGAPNGPAEESADAPNIEVVEAAGLRWLHIEQPRPADRAWLEEHFDFHPLDYEDVLSRNQRPKVDEYPEYLFVVLHFPRFDKAIGRLNAAELDIFVGPDFVITLPNEPLQPLEYLFERCKTRDEQRESLFAKGPGYLLYKIVDDCVDASFPMLRKMGNKLERLEEDIFEGRSGEIVRDISNVKQEIINFRKIVRPQRTALRDLERTKRYIPEGLDIYFDDINDASERIWDMLENFKEVVEGLESTNESVLSHQVNDVLKALTAISVVVLPLTLVASIWGMNVGVPGRGLAHGVLDRRRLDGRAAGRACSASSAAAAGCSALPSFESLEQMAAIVELDRSAQRKRMLVIVNPCASTMSVRLRGLVIAALQGRYDVDAVDTRARDHATELCRAAAGEGYDVVVSFGGDGTVNEIANALAGTDTPLTCLPGGATNVFCQMLGIPGEIVDATEHLLRMADVWRPRRIDLGTANGRCFTYGAGYGFDASVVKRIDRQPKLKRHRLRELYFVYCAVETALREYVRDPPRMDVARRRRRRPRDHDARPERRRVHVPRRQAARARARRRPADRLARGARAARHAGARHPRHRAARAVLQALDRRPPADQRVRRRRRPALRLRRRPRDPAARRRRPHRRRRRSRLRRAAGRAARRLLTPVAVSAQSITTTSARTPCALARRASSVSNGSSSRSARATYRAS